MKNKNRFYVYVHRDFEGRIFYIGKGTGHRLRSRHGRSKKWYEIVAKSSWTFEKLIDSISEEKAQEIEVNYIKMLKPVANVHTKDISVREVKYDDFKDLYYCDESSPSGLRHVHGNSQTDYRKRIAGDVAGSLNKKSGYYTVHCKGANWSAHRVVWCLQNKKNFKTEFVDHINRNRGFNEVSNLRAVTRNENNKNSSIRPDNKTGFKGVHYIENLKLYVTTWVDDEAVAFKQTFSERKHGRDLALALAVELRQRKISELETYLKEEYLRLPALQGYTENQIEDLLKCELISSNTSGVNGVYEQDVRGGHFWVFRDSCNHTQRFSSKKFGEQSFLLAVEYKNYYEGKLEFDQLSSELKDHLLFPTGAGNSSGIIGVQFYGKNQDKIRGQVTVNGNNYVVTFDTKKIGLLPAIYKVLLWRAQMKNKKD